MSEGTPELAPFDAPAVDRLESVASAQGLLRLGVVGLDDPGFRSAADALDRFLADGRHGEMEFLARTREVRKDPTRMLAGARSLVVTVVPYGGEPAPVARYAQFHDYHTVVHRRLKALEACIHELRPGAHTLICVDTKPIMERAAAVLAGLGFLGKNGCLIVPGLGSYVVIGSILTDVPAAPIRAESPVVASWDACGSCTRCLDFCPTRAFEAPGSLDPRRCISYLTIEHRGEIGEDLAERMGTRIAGCDVCQEVCPHNASEHRGDRVPQVAWLAAPPGRPRVVDLERLANIGSAGHRSFVKATPLGRIPRRSLRRNALLALGNRQGPLTAREQAVIARALHDPEPQIRAAAGRILRRRGRPP